MREGVIWAEVLNRPEDKMDLYFVDAKIGEVADRADGDNTGGVD